MKILILGSNGHLGKYFVDLLKSQKNVVIFTVSSSNSLEHRKNHSAIDLNKDIKKLYNLIIKNNFNLIINCLLIKNIHNKFDTVIPKKIVNFLSRKKFKSITWIEVSSYSILLKHKNHYMIEKKRFELFLYNKFRNNLKNLKILRIGNFLEGQYLDKIFFFKFLNNIIIPSNPLNNIFLTNKNHLKNFLFNYRNNNNLFFNLVEKSNFDELFKKKLYKKRIFYLHLNDKLFLWTKYFLNESKKEKLYNFLNLFFS